MTGKKRKFANLVACAQSEGKEVPLYECAIRAGYSERTARQTASRLIRDKDVIRYIEVFNAKADVNLQKAVKHVSDRAPEDAPLPSKFSDPKEYLSHMMNRMVEEDPKLGIDCAKALMPYHHIRKGDAGVKKNKEEKAKEAAQESRFKPRVV